MNSIVEWLSGLGLAQYAQRFVENDIDLGVAASLTDDDLKELGIPSLGHRRRILGAIADMRALGEQNAPVSSLTSNASEDLAERRQLSVMFCDLVDSTALSSKLDPEEMSKVIAAYQAVCSPIVSKYDGLVAKFMGDGILAYFGYPRAHEDDAERTVRAALDIVAAVARVKTPAEEPLSVRIGIATGLVVVGDLGGEGTLGEHAVIGDTPSLAARLQALVEPGTVVVASSTRRLLGDLFRLRDLGLHKVKGIAEPIAAWAVDGVSASQSRFEAVHAAGLADLIGRE